MSDINKHSETVVKEYDYKYSIIIPAHNRPQYIEDIINRFDKVIGCEILIMENGSNFEKLSHYYKVEKRYKDKDNVNFGFMDTTTAQVARKEGVDKAKGEGIFFCDDDDVPTGEFIKGLNSNILITNTLYTFNLTNANNWVGYPPKHLNKYFINDNLHVSSLLLERNLLMIVYNNYEIPGDIIVGEDQIMMSFIYQESMKLGYNLIASEIFSIMFNYFGNSDSITRGQRSIHLELQINKGLLLQPKSDINVLLFQKMIISRLRDNNNNLYIEGYDYVKELIIDVNKKYHTDI